MSKQEQLLCFNFLEIWSIEGFFFNKLEKKKYLHNPGLKQVYSKILKCPLIK